MEVKAVQLQNNDPTSVLFYSSVCWRVTTHDMKRIDAFHNKSLRKICRIFLPEKISSKELHRKTKCTPAVSEIKRRRLRRLGHALRMDQDCIPKVALRWTPTGKRSQGRPKTTWGRTVTAELKEISLTWGEAQHAAQDRSRWREIVEALCPTWDEEG